MRGKIDKKHTVKKPIFEGQQMGQHQMARGARAAAVTAAPAVANSGAGGQMEIPIRKPEVLASPKDEKMTTPKAAAGRADRIPSPAIEKQPALLDAPSVQPVDGDMMRTAQLLALIPFAAEAGVDEGFLRNRTDGGKPNPRTGLPWIPKPDQGNWRPLPVMAGLVEWFWYQGRAKGFPETFATQRDFTAATGLPLSLLEYLRKKGAQVILPGSRVDFRAVLAAIGKLGVEQMDYIDGDYEEKRLTRERADEQAMLNAEKRGEVLFSQDRQLAIGELQATEVLFEQFLAPFKKELLELAKRDGFYAQITALLAKHLQHLPREIEDADRTL
jgi:hypothetical protein